MKRTIYLLAFIVACYVLTASSCHKTSSPPVEQIPLGGTGGKITIVAFPEHHGKPVLNHLNYPDTAFIKFNTQEYPGAEAKQYDTLYIGETGEDHVHLKNLKKGNYYIYMVGYDSTISERVFGGIPVSYKLFTTDNGELNLHIPVTE